jgi:hypothetical protein
LNNAVSGDTTGFGGGIYNISAGEVIVKGSTISNNIVSGATGVGWGGGIYTRGTGTLTVQDASSVVRNFASDLGGGTFTDLGTTTISPDSTVAKNIPNDIYP